MARFYPGVVRSPDRAPVTLFGKITFGASGAVESVDAVGFSAAKVGASTGLYDVTLDDPQLPIIGITLTPREDDVFENIWSVVDVTNGVLRVAFSESAGGGTYEDPAGELYMSVTVLNTSAARTGL